MTPGGIGGKRPGRKIAGPPAGEPAAPKKSGKAEKAAAVQKAGETDRLERTSQKRGDLPIRKAAFDPIATLPPHAEAGATPEAANKAASELENIARAATEPALQEILQKAAAAVRKVGDIASLDKPVRISLKEDPKRPPSLEGRIERSIRGSGDNQRLHLIFRPALRDFQPFPIPRELGEGLPAGAKATLELERTEDGKQHYTISAREELYATSMVGTVAVEDGKAFVESRGILSPYRRVPLDGTDAVKLAGRAVVAEILAAPEPSRVARVREDLGAAGAPKAHFLQYASDAGTPLDFSAQVMREIAAIKKDPQISGKDLTHLPFCTIDYETSMDLDQAVCIQRRKDGGYDVHYAIADAAHFVKEGSAIDQWAQRRALSTYLPDRSIPMLPRELSEDLCSLVANQNRRAFVVTIKLDAKGEIVGQEFQRGVVRSRAKLAYAGVQAFHDAGKKGALAGHDYSETLALLRKVGELRIAAARERGVVSSDEGKTAIRPANAEATKFAIGVESRNEVEKWNEQVSLLANEVVGRFLQAEGVRVLHRVHMPPDPAKVDAFRQQVEALGVPWPQDVPLSDYVAGLDPAHVRTRAIRRLATRINRAASYSTEPLGHSALKLDAYDHFTAPMRRYSDIVVHRVLAALIEEREVPHQDGNDLDRIAGRLEAAKRRESDIAARCRGFMTAAVLADELGASKPATVVGVSPAGVVVELDEPRVEVIVSTRALQQAGKGGAYTLGLSGTALSGPAGTFQLGDRLDVTVTAADPAAGKVDALPSSLVPGTARRLAAV